MAACGSPPAVTFLSTVAGRLPFRIRRTRSGAHSCSYEEGEFLNTPGLALLGRPATVGSRWRADRCRIEWFGAARNGNVLPRVAGGPSKQLGSSAWRRTPAGHPPPRSLIEVRQATDSPYATGCRPRQHGTKGGGFAPRYYSATHIWASTTRTETLPPNRVVGVNTNTRWAPPAPTGRRAPLPWWRAEFHHSGHPASSIVLIAAVTSSMTCAADLASAANLFVLNSRTC